jgi:hypothetical protein
MTPIDQRFLADALDAMSGIGIVGEIFLKRADFRHDRKVDAKLKSAIRQFRSGQGISSQDKWFALNMIEGMAQDDWPFLADRFDLPVAELKERLLGMVAELKSD